MAEHNSQAEDRVRQEYGSLATRFNEALGQVAECLRPHADLLPEKRVDEVDELHQEFERRRVQIAVYGEVKAGKSTLVNAIAGSVVSPSAFDPLTSVPVRVSYGKQPSWWVGDHVFETVAELTRAMREGLGGADEVVVYTDLDLLQLGGQVDLLDTPGVGSEERLDAISDEALRSLDAVVLVVRYPALFTKFTRQLRDHLEKDISKLFVVWNIDTACSELSPEEKERQAENLRKNVAGAHELYLVDGRMGLRAKQSGDGKGLKESGLDEFSRALARFASSEKREVSALREAAKRTTRWLDEGHRSFLQRHSALDISLRNTRERLDAVVAKAEGQRKTVQTSFAAFKSSVEEAGTQHAKKAAALVKSYRKKLRFARRSWIWSGEENTLGETLRDIVNDYADDAERGTRETTDLLHEAARAFGTVASAAPRNRLPPDLGELSPEERKKLSATGRMKPLRRALWRRWYLPGVTQLEREGFEADLQNQKTWFGEAAGNAESAAQATLDAGLQEIAEQEEKEVGGIKEETSFVAEEAEFNSLVEKLPTIEEASSTIVKINKAAWDLAS